jgi:two-component system, cell cycle sensor histidine kinase and response regulator CckA
METRIPSKLTGGVETVLFIDDESMILTVGKQMMEKMGYDVLVADSGKEAVKVYEAQYEQIDMVILDLVMPDMGGGETYDALRAINSDVKVLLSSGYNLDCQAEEVLARGCDGFLQKPFNMNELCDNLRTILDRQEPSQRAPSPRLDLNERNPALSQGRRLASTNAFASLSCRAV